MQIIFLKWTISKNKQQEKQKQVDIQNTKVYKLKQGIDRIQELISGLYTDYKSNILNLNDYQDMKA